jgi:transposase
VSTRRSLSGCWSIAGFPLEIGCYEGNKAETTTIIPIVKQFQVRHGMADMVVVADAGMLSASNLRDLDEAGLRFIVGSRVTKAPKPTWPPTSGGTVTRSPMVRSSTPSPPQRASQGRRE